MTSRSDALRAWLEGEEFDAAAYRYRATPGYLPPNVLAAYEALKKAIRDKYDELDVSEGRDLPQREVPGGGSS